MKTLFETSGCCIQITAEFGRKLNVSESKMNEWLNDLPEQIDAIMSQPLRIGNDSSAGLSRFAFCAPEMIRGAITTHILKTNLENL